MVPLSQTHAWETALGSPTRRAARASPAGRSKPRESHGEPCPGSCREDPPCPSSVGTCRSSDAPYPRHWANEVEGHPEGALTGAERNGNTRARLKAERTGPACRRARRSAARTQALPHLRVCVPRKLFLSLTVKCVVGGIPCVCVTSPFLKRKHWAHQLRYPAEVSGGGNRGLFMKREIHGSQSE